MKSLISWQNVSEYPLTGPQPDCGILEKTAKWVNGDWMNKKKKEIRAVRTWIKTCEGFPSRTSSVK
jgi:hypothetical protein